MSLKLSSKTPNKKEVSTILRAIADWIETSSNQTITIDLTLIFNKCEEADG